MWLCKDCHELSRVCPKEIQILFHEHFQGHWSRSSRMLWVHQQLVRVTHFTHTKWIYLKTNPKKELEISWDGYWSLKVLFCSGSRTSSNAEAGSPRTSAPVLSISSNNMTGLFTPTLWHHQISFAKKLQARITPKRPKCSASCVFSSFEQVTWGLPFVQFDQHMQCSALILVIWPHLNYFLNWSLYNHESLVLQKIIDKREPSRES